MPHFCCVAPPYPQVCHTKPGVEQCCAGLHLHQTTTEIGRMLASDVRGDTLRLGIQRSSGTWPQTHTQTQAFRNRNLPYRCTTSHKKNSWRCPKLLTLSKISTIFSMSLCLKKLAHTMFLFLWGLKSCKHCFIKDILEPLLSSGRALHVLHRSDLASHGQTVPLLHRFLFC